MPKACVKCKVIISHACLLCLVSRDRRCVSLRADALTLVSPARLLVSWYPNSPIETLASGWVVELSGGGTEDTDLTERLTARATPGSVHHTRLAGTILSY